MFSFVLSLPLLVTGFSPQIAKVTSKIQSETIDYAKEDIEDKLEMAQSLLDRKLITEEEYKQMRKNILGIK